MSEELKLPDFLIIPSILVVDEDLRPTDHLIYGVVYWYSRLKLEKCILSNKGFMDLLGISESAVQYGLRRMSQKGYIQVVFEDEKKTLRKEIIPLITFENTRIIEVDKCPSPPADLSTPPRTIVHQNNIDLIRRSNNTVNGNGIIKKLPTQPITTEERDYLKGEILRQLKDNHSERFYSLVALKVPKTVIFKALSEIRVDGARHPAKLFSFKMKRYALAHRTI